MSVIYQSGSLTMNDYDSRFKPPPKKKFCYVMEFKLDGTARQALEQIQDRNYTLPFSIEDQQIFRLGINFDSKTRNIDQCLVG